MPTTTNFRISSELKNVIGRDLITDDFVAIFELVKNSFDAHATDVKIFFDFSNKQEAIYIIDNGKGMSEMDIQKKWLFVAYSAKQVQRMQAVVLTIMLAIRGSADFLVTDWGSIYI